jgi:hypothetical protein
MMLQEPIMNSSVNSFGASQICESDFEASMPALFNLWRPFWPVFAATGIGMSSVASYRRIAVLGLAKNCGQSNKFGL